MMITRVSKGGRVYQFSTKFFVGYLIEYASKICSNRFSLNTNLIDRLNFHQIKSFTSHNFFILYFYDNSMARFLTLLRL